MLRARGKQSAEWSSTSTLPSNVLQLLGNVNDGDQHSDGRSTRRRRLMRRTGQSSNSQRLYACNIDSMNASPISLIIGCLFFAVAFEIGYILATGPLSDGAGWPTRTSSASTNDQSAQYTIRILKDLSPIDDYYSRPHIRESVPLIVGGSDGSGTRAFVQILELLNVPIVVEDRGTMDVHGIELYDGAGWPALVSRVLNTTRSASYDLSDIPDPTRRSAKTELGKFLKSVKAAGSGMVEARTDKTWATSVSWAFKAPVSILLLPFFREQLPAMKVLHVVRDGRDVSLSDNHSPVQKFYTAFYPDAEARHKTLLGYEEFGKDKRTNIKAMQLWNDWNRQVYEYGVRHSDGQTLDVLVMRTEDLLHYPLESIALLADFVGSLHSSHQLCCLSRLSAADLGQSLPGDPLEDLVEAGEAEGAIGIGGPRMYDPHDFNEVRKRFRAFIAGRGDSKILSHSDQTKDATGRRQLFGAPHANDDTADLFKSGGKLASDIHPGNDLRKYAVASAQQGGSNEVARLHQLILEKRFMAAKRASAAQEDVKTRYGKWTKSLGNDPELSKQLHKYGKEALSLFGYEPPREFMDIHPHPELLFTCDSSVVCPS